MSIVEPLTGTGAFLGIALAIELIAPLYQVTWKSRLLGLQMTLAKAVAVGLLIPVLYAGWSAAGFQPVRLGSVGGIAGVALAIFVNDFLAYWHHRFLHRFFWPVHATHHSIRELSAVNSYAHFAEKVSQFLVMVIPLSLVSWDSPAVPAAIVWAITWSEYWIHSPTTAQFSGLRSIFVTPPFHRIHHSVEPQHFDKNFGILFSFWDRMFGTAVIPAADEWPETGLEGHDEPRSLFAYVIHPLTYLGIQDRPPSGTQPSPR